jgi:hypothetical protein
MAPTDHTPQSSASSIVVGLQREYRLKTIVFYLVFLVFGGMFLFRQDNSRALDPFPIVLLFAIIVDLIAIRRSIRICRSFMTPTT